MNTSEMSTKSVWYKPQHFVQKLVLLPLEWILLKTLLLFNSKFENSLPNKDDFG